MKKKRQWPLLACVYLEQIQAVKTAAEQITGTLSNSREGGREGGEEGGMEGREGRREIAVRVHMCAEWRERSVKEGRDSEGR